MSYLRQILILKYAALSFKLSALGIMNVHHI